MQEKLTIARPYAAAAFEYAAQRDDVESWSGMLEVLAIAVTDPNLRGFIGHPKVSDEQLLAILDDVLGARLDQARRNYVKVLIDSERLEIAPQIAELFERRRADAAGLVKVEVRSAFPLNETERQTIDAAMSSRLGRKCTVEASLDETLIGGAVIKIGDSVIDLSLRGRLAALGQQIT